MPSLNTQPNGGRALLEEACAKGVPLEVRVLSDAQSRTVKLLILDLDDENVYVENPEYGLKPVHLPTEGVLECFLNMNDTRFGFQSVVTNPRVLVRLTGDRKAVGIVITRPDKLIAQQRRSFFRLSLLSGEPIKVVLHAAFEEDDEEGVCKLEERRFSGELVNLSIGGAAVRLELEDARAVQISDQAFVTFALPWGSASDEFVFLAEIRQARVIEEQSESRFGLCFVEWPDKRQFEQNQQLLQRFITQAQRDRLRRVS